MPPQPLVSLHSTGLRNKVLAELDRLHSDQTPEFIHPFADGNGRIGRLWQTLILSRWNPLFAFLPVEAVIHERQADYYKVLAACDKAGNSTALIERTIPEKPNSRLQNRSEVEMASGKYRLTAKGRAIVKQLAIKGMITFL